MLLTDPAVQYWSCVVAILTTVAVLMLWNRVRGPLVVRGLSRAGLLIGGYTATAVAVLVSVNIAYGGLIVSVSDLFANVNPPMGRFAQHGGCGGDHGDRDMRARALAAASAAAHSSAAARNPGKVFDDAEAPPPGVDPALGDGDGGGRPCETASAAPSAVGPSAAAPASAAPAEAHALR
jgi:hypothetical protein